MNSHTTKSFRDALKQLTPEVRKQAREAYRQFMGDPFSPGLNFEEVNAQRHIWSARITRSFRVLGIRDRDDITWYWIGTHREYEKRKK
ncbi:MAG: hypothetical protein ACRDHP_03285 [Ktedonobacterales bacterium]